MTEQIKSGYFQPVDSPADPHVLHIVSWNINRGLQLPRIIEFLGNASADLVLLQEVDINARRTQCRNVAREIAEALRMHYVFGREFEELTQGNHESPAYHGQATLSKLPIFSSTLLEFRRQSSFWRPRWFIPMTQTWQRRLGARIALVSHITWEHKPLIVYNLHLESRGNDELRHSQLTEVLDDAARYDSGGTVVIAGDFNLDLLHEPAVQGIGTRAFNNPFESGEGCRPTSRPRLGRGRTIDGIFIRGPLACVSAQVHDSVVASDHYPISVTLRPS